MNIDYSKAKFDTVSNHFWDWACVTRSSALNDIGGVPVALQVPRLNRILLQRKRCEELCNPMTATSGCAAIVAYRSLVIDTSNSLDVDKIPPSEKANNFMMLLARHLQETDDMARDLAVQFEGLIEAHIRRAALENVHFVEALEQADNLDTHYLLKQSKSSHLKKIRGIWVTVRDLTGAYDELVDTFIQNLPGEDDGTNFADHRCKFKEKIREQWIKLHQIVAACFVIEVLFGGELSDEDRYAKVRANVETVATVLADGPAVLPARLGLAWSDLRERSRQ